MGGVVGVEWCAPVGPSVSFIGQGRAARLPPQADARPLTGAPASLSSWSADNYYW